MALASVADRRAINKRKKEKKKKRKKKQSLSCLELVQHEWGGGKKKNGAWEWHNIKQTIAVCSVESILRFTWINATTGVCSAYCTTESSSPVIVVHVAGTMKIN